MHKALIPRARKRQEAISRGAEYVRRIRENVDVLAGVVFGSYARGDFNLASDIDVLILSDRLPTDPRRRSELLYEYVEGPIEPKGYTRDEFADLLRRRNPIAVDAVRHGVSVWDKGCWQEIMNLFLTLT